MRTFFKDDLSMQNDSYNFIDYKRDYKCKLCSKSTLEIDYNSLSLVFITNYCVH